jgi:hypothetical protein
MTTYNIRVYQKLSRESYIEVLASSEEEAKMKVFEKKPDEVDWEWEAGDMECEIL